MPRGEPLENAPKPGSPQEAARFRELQAHLRDRYLRFRDEPRQPYTAIVVPSQSVDARELEKIPGVAHYEERALFNLMLLRHPRLEVVFVTSKRLNPLVIDYYLHQMRGVPSAHALRRLHLLDCDDASARPLTQKILERPRLMQRIHDAIVDPEMAHLVVFNSSPLERSLSVQLGVPLNATDPALGELGTKTGSRRVFIEAGIPVAPGRDGLRDVTDLSEGIAELWGEHPSTRYIVSKLNDSFSGEGNARLDLRSLGPVPKEQSARCAVVKKALPSILLEAPDVGFDAYSEQFDAMGGVCEIWVEGEGKTSPSAQMRINPVREVQSISTHDQVLGGPSGQVFIGASFPAAPQYRLPIQQMGRAVGQVLANHGAIGRFGVDFLVVPNAAAEGGHDFYAVEINLRQGATTHPFNTLKFITDGQYDEETGEFRTAQGQSRSYFATDCVSSPDYRGILPFDLIDQLVLHGIHFRPDETGVVFHLLGCLSEFGKLGCTAIGSDLESAKALYDETLRILDALSPSRSALAEP